MTKSLVWVGGSKKEFDDLPEAVQDDFGHALWLAQKGEKAEYAKPLKGFGGASVLELKESLDGEAYRAIYTTQIGDKICVLGAFHKKSKSGIGLPKHQTELIEQRLKEARKLYGSRAG